MWKWVPDHSRQHLTCVHLIGWGGLCIFCFPHSIWFLSPFRNVPPDKHPGSQLWSWAPAPCPWKTISTACWPASPPPHASPCTGFVALLCSLLNSSFHPTFIRDISATTMFSCQKTCHHDCLFPWLHKQGNTSYPTSPPSSPLFLKYVRPEM